VSYVLFTPAGPIYHQEFAMNSFPTPTFSIYKANSAEKVETLQACHIERLQFKRGEETLYQALQSGIFFLGPWFLSQQRSES
jgi:hypothetical protein